MAKIPAHAERVFKGVIFDVYQWQQTMFDGSIETFEMIKRPDTVMVIAMQGDKVLYTQQEQPHKPSYFSLFGGRAEDGEEPLDTGKRELLEESGLASDHWHQLRVIPFPGKLEWTVYFYVARDCYKIAEPKLDPGERIEIKSCSLDDLITTLLPNPNFMGFELQREIMSALNPAAVTKLKSDIMAKQIDRAG